MKVAFHTLGCKVNSYETQAVAEQFAALGFEIVDYSESADVYVLNTCSVTKEAARKSRQILNRAKKHNPDAVTVATGCYAQEDAQALRPAADLIVGNNEKSRIAELVWKRLTEKDKTTVLVDDLTHCRQYEKQEIAERNERVRAYVKIQDGCNRFCAYCIIPYLRGRSRSRELKDILDEVNRLTEKGYQEIILTGIDISDFVLDGKRPGEEPLLVLLKELDQIEGVKRVRLGSLEEGIVTEDFVRQAASLSHLCPQFHLSLQSGSDTVLKRMNRKYTTAQFAETVQMLRACFDRPALTTDIITGFPGETEQEFEETMSFVRQTAFSAVHVFKYSRRKGTAADRMPDQLTDRVKTERSERLIALAKELGRDYRAQFIGEMKEVLFEEQHLRDGVHYLTGFTPEYFKVEVKEEQDLVGQIKKVLITPDVLNVAE